MATITQQTLDARLRTQFIVKTAGEGLNVLPFEIVTIDSDFQAYEPISGAYADEQGMRRRGVLTNPVFLASNRALPRAARLPTQGEEGVWEYHGI